LGSLFLEASIGPQPDSSVIFDDDITRSRIRDGLLVDLGSRLIFGKRAILATGRRRGATGHRSGGAVSRS
jgi:hypothetical protein